MIAKYEWVTLFSGDPEPPGLIGWAGWTEDTRSTRAMAEEACQRNRRCVVAGFSPSGVYIDVLNGHGEAMQKRWDAKTKKGWVCAYGLVETKINNGCPCGICQGEV